jgi:cobalt-zinc-cadmium efflux system membrane fusion protein
MNPSTPPPTPDIGEGAPRPRAARRLVFAASGALALGALALAVRAGGSSGAGASAPAERDVPAQDGSLIHFSRAFAERAGLKSAEAREQPIAPLVEVPGVVGLDPRKVASVGARIQGRVREVHRFPGDEVKAGDALAELESAELGRAQAEVLKLRAREEAALADEEREQKLLEAKVTSLRDAQAARATAEALRAERLAAEKAVLALGGGLPSREIGTLTLRSPIAGKVLASKVTRGQFIDPTHTAFEIADLGTVWLELSVFERDLPAIHEGDEVEFWAQAQPERKLRGRVARLGEVIDAASQSTGVRVEVDNADRALRPGQGVRARIIAGRSAATQLSIPSEAIITVDGRPTVFVAKDAQTVEIRPISVGTSGQALTAVLEGLRAGESVIASGVFALKSEIFR